MVNQIQNSTESNRRLVAGTAMIVIGLGIIMGAVAYLRLETAAAERILWNQRAVAYARYHLWTPSKLYDAGIKR